MMSVPQVRSPFVWSLTKRQVCSLLLIVTLICSSCVIAGYSYAASIGAQKYPTSYMEGGPTGDYDYMIYTFQNDTNTYYAAKNSFGDNIDAWTSTNQTAVLAEVANSASVGSVVVAQSGVFGVKACSLIVGNGTEAFTAGNVAYESAINFYSVASASAAGSIGYGYVWLIAINSAANAHCLLMDTGIFTLGTWSLTAGNVWVSTTGTVTSTCPSATGNQMVSMGVMLNATTIRVQNPNGFYQEHP